MNPRWTHLGAMVLGIVLTALVYEIAGAVQDMRTALVDTPAPAAAPAASERDKARAALGLKPVSRAGGLPDVGELTGRDAVAARAAAAREVALAAGERKLADKKSSGKKSGGKKGSVKTKKLSDEELVDRKEARARHREGMDENGIMALRQKRLDKMATLPPDRLERVMAQREERRARLEEMGLVVSEDDLDALDELDELDAAREAEQAGAQP